MKSHAESSPFAFFTISHDALRSWTTLNRNSDKRLVKTTKSKHPLKGCIKNQ